MHTLPLSGLFLIWLHQQWTTCHSVALKLHSTTTAEFQVHLTHSVSLTLAANKQKFEPTIDDWTNLHEIALLQVTIYWPISGASVVLVLLCLLQHLSTSLSSVQLATLLYVAFTHPPMSSDKSNANKQRSSVISTGSGSNSSITVTASETVNPMEFLKKRGYQMGDNLGEGSFAR